MADEIKFLTKCIHVGNDIDKETGAIRRPITMANSYRLPDDASTLNWSNPNNVIYTRTTSANQLYLQERLSALEGEKTALYWPVVLQLWQEYSLHFWIKIHMSYAQMFRILQFTDY